MKLNNFLKISPIYFFVSFFIFLTLLYACAMKTSPNIVLSSQDNKKIPIKVGYYLAPKLTDVRYSKKAGSLLVWSSPLLLATTTASSIKVGETLCNGVQTVLQAAFDEVIKIPSMDTDLKSQNIKAVVIPELLFLDINVPMMSSRDEAAIVKMKWTVEDADKNILYVKEITSEVHEFCYVDSCRKKLLHRAIQDHFQKAYDSIIQQKCWEAVK